jgi:hypothetical protein
MAPNFKLGMSVFLGGALALCLLALAGWRRDHVEADVPGPRTLKEVVQVATELGLYYRSDRADRAFDNGIRYRLVVSESPLTFERAGELRFKPGDQCWDGTVAVTLDRAHGFYHFFALTADEYPGWVARWGDFFLFGDPALIRRLTAGSQ